MNRKWFVYALTIIVLIVVFLVLKKTIGVGNDEAGIVVDVQYGDFVVEVVTTGELKAKQSEKIKAPSTRNVNIWEVSIQNMVTDGTVVDSGDWVADLNRTEIDGRLKDYKENYETSLTAYNKTKLDTAITLRNARDELVNLKFAVEEADIMLQQSQFEPPATIRQYRINYEKAQRALQQAIDNYKLSSEKAVAEMSTVAVDLNKKERKLQECLSLMEKFTITAPKSGMVVYARDWNGKKIGVGSTVSAWDPVVAELPDLSKMLSKTYVNEIDVSKVKTGQSVTITVEAFPEKHFSGMVESVANMGEQISGSNAKVYEVMVSVNEYDSMLRPAMTTVNNIKIESFPDCLYIPIESVDNEGDVSFVYSSHGHKKEVKLGMSNANHVVVLKGLEKNEKIYILPPEGADKWNLVRL